MSGVTGDEGFLVVIMLLPEVISEQPCDPEVIINKLKAILGPFFNLHFGDESEAKWKEVIEFYDMDELTGDALKRKITEAVGDFIIIPSTYQVARLHSGRGQI